MSSLHCLNLRDVQPFTFDSRQELLFTARDTLQVGNHTHLQRELVRKPFEPALFFGPAAFIPPSALAESLPFAFTRSTLGKFTLAGVMAWYQIS